MNNFLISQVDPSASYKSGYYTGQILIAVLLLAGALKCISIARRPTTNKKCVHSLTCFLLSFLLTAASQPLVRAFPEGQRVIFGVLGLIVFAGLITGIVLAILGLFEYSRKKADYIQGRKQAIATLVISALFLVTFIGGVIKGRERALSLTADQPDAGEVLVFADLNYSFNAPAKPWVKINAKNVNKIASLGFMRASPQLYFMVVAENAGISSDMENAQLCRKQNDFRKGVSTATPATGRAATGKRSSNQQPRHFVHPLDLCDQRLRLPTRLLGQSQ